MATADITIKQAHLLALLNNDCLIARHPRQNPPEPVFAFIYQPARHSARRAGLLNRCWPARQ